MINYKLKKFRAYPSYINFWREPCSKVPKCFIGLIQMQCSPSFDCNWGKQNDPFVCWHQLNPQFRVLQQVNCFTYPPDCVGGVTETPNCVDGRGYPLYNSPRTRYFGQRAAKKPSTLLVIFMGLCLTTITNISSAL